MLNCPQDIHVISLFIAYGELLFGDFYCYAFLTGNNFQ
jgi:hypothetical protein